MGICKILFREMEGEISTFGANISRIVPKAFVDSQIGDQTSVKKRHVD